MAEDEQGPTNSTSDDLASPSKDAGRPSPGGSSPKADPPSTTVEEAPASGSPQSAPSSAAVPAGGSAKTSNYTPSYVFLLAVTIVNLVADLWSKAWAKGHFEALRPGEPRRVIVWEDHMNFIFAKNRGGAWGLLQNETEALRRPFFLIVSVAAIVFIVTLYRKLQPGQTALKWGLPLVLGGALGNLVDRIRYGFVVDFIDVYMQMDGAPKHWPTFNVADISICIGVALMAIDMFTSREATTEKPAPNSKAPVDIKSSETNAEPGAANVDDPGMAKDAETKADETVGERV